MLQRQYTKIPSTVPKLKGKSIFHLSLHSVLRQILCLLAPPYPFNLLVSSFSDASQALNNSASAVRLHDTRIYYHKRTQIYHG